MATYIFHRLIMGKVEIDKSLNWDIWIFLQKCLLSNRLRFIRLLSKSLNLISCQGDKKDEFSRKKCLKKIRNHKVDEADTLHTYF